MRVASLAAVIAAAALAGACGPKVRPDYPMDEDGDGWSDTTAEAPAREDEEPPAPPPVVAPTGPVSQLARKEVVAVLDAGPAVFLKEVRIEAHLVRRKFAGWKVVSLGRYAVPGVDLQPGDVVVRVNGRPLERPEQLRTAWDSLRTAPDLTIEYLRGYESRILRFPITD